MEGLTNKTGSGPLSDTEAAAVSTENMGGAEEGGKGIAAPQSCLHTLPPAASVGFCYALSLKPKGTAGFSQVDLRVNGRCFNWLQPGHT